MEVAKRVSLDARPNLAVPTSLAPMEVVVVNLMAAHQFPPVLALLPCDVLMVLVKRALMPVLFPRVGRFIAAQVESAWKQSRNAPLVPRVHPHSIAVLMEPAEAHVRVLPSRAAQWVRLHALKVHTD